MKRAATNGEESLNAFAVIVIRIEMLVVAAIICYACTEPASVGHAATWLGADTIDPRGPKGCEATYEARTLAHIITPFMVLYALHDALVKPMPGKAQAASPPIVQKGDRFLLSGQTAAVHSGA